jgi:hypothetical protein
MLLAVQSFQERVSQKDKRLRRFGHDIIIPKYSYAAHTAVGVDIDLLEDMMSGRFACNHPRCGASYAQR